jgi:cation:H+ antiporter
MTTTWLSFLVCVLTIGIAGTLLTRYGDAIADKTGLGGSWIGLVLLATVTSLPELAAGVSAVTIANVPNIAAGDVFGSCAYNLLLLVLLDFLLGQTPLYAHARRGHILAAGFGIILLGFMGFNLVLAQNQLSWTFLHVGMYSPLVFLLYAVSIRTVFLYEKAQVAEFTEKEPDRYPERSVRSLAVRYAIAAGFVVAAGIWLPYVAADIAVQMGWTQTFVGTMFAALVTSLPEMVVTVVAVRIGALDLAIGDLLGSNMFNILILAVDDVFYHRDGLLNAISSIHLTSAIAAMTMTGAAIVGLYFRSKRQLFNRLSWTSVFMVIAYVTNAWVLYVNDHPSLRHPPASMHARPGVQARGTVSPSLPGPAANAWPACRNAISSTVAGAPALSLRRQRRARAVHRPP